MIADRADTVCLLGRSRRWGEDTVPVSSDVIPGVEFLESESQVLREIHHCRACDDWRRTIGIC